MFNGLLKRHIFGFNAPYFLSTRRYVGLNIEEKRNFLLQKIFSFHLSISAMLSYEES